MSFQGYDQFQSPGGQEGAPPQMQAQPQQDGTMGGQPGEQAQTPSQYTPGGEGNGAPGAPGGDQKTTLWYVVLCFGHRTVLTTVKDG